MTGGRPTATRILFIGGRDAWFPEIVDEGTAVETRGFGRGLRDLEFEFEEHLAARGVIKHARRAEREGLDAVVIGCFYDPGLWAARELVELPVIGVGDATLHTASMLSAGRFSVLVGRAKWIPRMEANARRVGLDTRIASWRVLDLSVNQMEDDDAARDAVLREATRAVEDDRAEVVCLGCTGLAGQAWHAQETLGVPVLDPVLVGLKTAEHLGRLHRRFGISHSKVGGFAAPPAGEVERVLAASEKKPDGLLTWRRRP